MSSITLVTPYLVVSGADETIAFYQAAFGAEEIFRMTDPPTVASAMPNCALARARHAER